MKRARFGDLSSVEKVGFRKLQHMVHMFEWDLMTQNFADEEGQ